MSRTAIETAQSIIESLEDIRPEYKGRQVVSVEQLDEPFSVRLRFTEGPAMKLVGLYAKVILTALERERV